MSFTVNERLLTISNLNLSYEGRSILRDINLHVDNISRHGVEQGQVVALLGLSGSGKTQLFRCISGVQQPTSGEVRLGTDQQPVVAGKVGVVQQAYPLLNHRTVQGNLELAGKSLSQRERGLLLLAEFGLADKVNHYPQQLSGGQRQRVAIIQQLIASGYFLLMDEPFSGLDLVAKRKVYDTILKVSVTHEHNTTIFTTHDVEAAVHLADQIWIIGKEPEKEGSTVVEKIDLASAGLAWSQDIEKHPLYWPMVQRVKDKLKTL